MGNRVSIIFLFSYPLLSIILCHQLNVNIIMNATNIPFFHWICLHNVRSTWCRLIDANSLVLGAKIKLLCPQYSSFPLLPSCLSLQHLFRELEVQNLIDLHNSGALSQSSWSKYLSDKSCVENQW